jgi:hypothetical protein
MIPERKMLPGEQGVPMKASTDAAALASQWETRMKQLAEARRGLMRAKSLAGSRGSLMTSKQQAEIKLKIDRLFNEETEASAKVGTYKRQAEQAANAEKLVMVGQETRMREQAQADAAREKESHELGQYVTALKRAGEQVPDDITHLEAKTLYETKYAPKVAAREDTQAFQSDQARIKAESRAKEFEERAGRLERGMDLKERTQTFRESMGKMKFASDGAKADAKANMDRATFLLNEAKLLDKTGEGAEAAAKIQEADDLVQRGFALGEGASVVGDVTTQAAPAAGAPGPAGAAGGMSVDDAKAADLRERDRLGLQPGSPEAKALQEQFKARVR